MSPQQFFDYIRMATPYTAKEISDILDDTKSTGKPIPIIETSGARFPYVGRAVSTIIYS